jgi:hypothetical protein
MGLTTKEILENEIFSRENIISLLESREKTDPFSLRNLQR